MISLNLNELEQKKLVKLFNRFLEDFESDKKDRSEKEWDMLIGEAKVFEELKKRINEARKRED